jgi:hypothetical protein
VIAHQLGAVDQGRIIGKLHALEDISRRRIMTEEGIQVGIR